MTRPGPQTLHPADKALLRPLASLGKPNAASGAVSFLRRTEYTASQNTQHFSSSTSKDLLRLRNDAKRRKPSLNKEDPINIMRNIVKGFDIAYPRDAYRGEDSTTNLRGAQVTDTELKAWSNPRHPSKPELKLLDSYPILPDLEAIPTTGFYMVMKFSSNPVEKTDSYDQRLDTAVLKPIADEQAEMQFDEKKAAWEESDKSKPEPIREYDYDYFLLNDRSAVPNLKRKLNVNDPENDDPELYTDYIDDGQRAFKYKRKRTYETFTQTGDSTDFYNDTVALALHDPESEVSTAPGGEHRLQKGAYFYPIVQRTGLRPKRIVGKMLYQMDEAKVDELNITVADMGEDVRTSQIEKRAQLDPMARTTEVAG